MKSRSKTVLLVSLLVSGLMTLGIACSDDEGGGDNSAPATGTSTIQPPANGEANDRDDFITTIGARLEQLETQIDELESEVDSRTGDEQAEARERIDDLKAEMADLQDELAQFLSEPDADFEAMKDDIESRLDSAMSEARELAEELGI